MLHLYSRQYVLCFLKIRLTNPWKFGEIKQVRVVRDDRGRSKGIAFVSFADVVSVFYLACWPHI
jgi:hypothetical protein